MEENKKKQSCKAISIISTIVRVLLIVGVLGWVVSLLLKQTATDPWDIYYASVANMVLLWVWIVSLVAYVALNLKKVWTSVKESARKLIVSLKRNPAVIPLIMMFVSFLVFSLNLTDMSDTTAKIQGKGMGLCQFAVMLFSLLCMVCLLNAFPRRKKANIPMVILAFVMFAILIAADVHYRNVILTALTRAENPIVPDHTTAYIVDAFNMLGTHMILVIVVAVLVVLLPVYSKLIRMIKTSVEVEDNGEMAAIEIDDEN